MSHSYLSTVPHTGTKQTKNVKPKVGLVDLSTHCGEKNFECSLLKSHSEEKLEAKKPYDFDRNQNRNALSKKEQPNTTGKKTRKFKPIKYIWLLGQ